METTELEVSEQTEEQRKKSEELFTNNFSKKEQSIISHKLMLANVMQQTIKSTLPYQKVEVSEDELTYYIYKGKRSKQPFVRLKLEEDGDESHKVIVSFSKRQSNFDTLIFWEIVGKSMKCHKQLDKDF